MPTPARKKAPARSVVQDAERLLADADTDVPELSTDDAPPPTLLFRLDGVPYYGLGVGSAWILIQYMEISAKKDESDANLWLLKAMLGDEAFETLSSHRGLEIDKFTRIIAICQKALMDKAPKAVKPKPRR